MKPIRFSLLALFVVFAAVNVAYLTSIPSLMGDEAHEGDNVYEILDTKQLTVLGERSYIGVLIDYIRIPFVFLFGYTTVALRSVMLLASLLFFGISAYLLRRVMGEEGSLIPLVFLSFSPIYLTQQRLGWAITLLPLFAVAFIFLLQSSWNNKYLLAGVIGGLGLANHLLFLPSLIAILAIALLANIRTPREYLRAWPLLIGFIAGFGMQFAILQLYPDDQGSQKVIAETFMTRIQAFPSLVPEIISGSSYIASYTGQELSPVLKMTILLVLSVLALVALILPRYRNLSWVILLALVVHLFVLLRIVDRFSLRYFTVFVLGFWLLAGIGFETIVAAIRKRTMPIAHGITVLVCMLLVGWWVAAVIVPYRVTGGATTVFSLGNRTDSAAALVDTSELFQCLKNLGPVYSENVHIYNRLIFWSRQYPEIEAVDEDHKDAAKFLVDYRIPGNKKNELSGTICTHLTHFRVTEK